MTTKSLLHSSLEDNQYYTSMLAGNAAYAPLEIQYLVIGGGGGGGSNVGSGAGAGGIFYATNQSFTIATNYTVTVGGGGAGGVSSAVGNPGIDSSFGSLAVGLGGGKGVSYAVPGKTGGSGGQEVVAHLPTVARQLLEEHQRKVRQVEQVTETMVELVEVTAPPARREMFPAEVAEQELLAQIEHPEIPLVGRAGLGLATSAQ